MTLQEHKAKVLEEFENQFGDLNGIQNRSYGDEIKSFISQAIDSTAWETYKAVTTGIDGELLDYGYRAEDLMEAKYKKFRS